MGRQSSGPRKVVVRLEYSPQRRQRMGDEKKNIESSNRRARNEYRCMH